MRLAMDPYFDTRPTLSQHQGLKPPRSPHGQRLLISQIDRIAKEDPIRKWIYTPKDDNDLTQGFKSISFRRFARAVNVAAIWLRDHLNLPFRGFPTFAYAGPNDYRYALFAVAAGKLGFQMMLPDPTITPSGQQTILRQKKCTVYLCTPETAPRVERVRKLEPSLRVIVVPELAKIMEKSPAESLRYMKSWEDARNDPWLVFHTSGTASPQTITYTHHMMASYDITLGLDDIGETHALQLPNTKIYMPVPPMHYIAMNMMLGGSVFARGIPVLGPVNSTPTPALVAEILKRTRLGGALLVPAVIDVLCEDPRALELLRKLKYIQYGGASLSKKTGELLSPYSRVAPTIGGADTGGYFCSFPNTSSDWDYVSFHPHAGATMVHRGNGKHELVFVRNPQCCMQTVFEAFPNLHRYETKDLWVEHPKRKGQWKIVGRHEDFEKGPSGHATFVSSLDAILEEPSPILSATLGGQPLPKSVAPPPSEAETAQRSRTRERSSTVESIPISEKSLTEELSQQSETQSTRNSSPVSERSSISSRLPISELPARSERTPVLQRSPVIERSLMYERSPVNERSPQKEVSTRTELPFRENPNMYATIPATPSISERRWSVDVPTRKAVPRKQLPPSARASFTMEVPIVMETPLPIPSPRELPSTAERPLTWESETTLNDDTQPQPHTDKLNDECNEAFQMDPKLIVFKMPGASWPRTLKNTTTPARSEGLCRYDSVIDDAYRRLI